MSFRHFSYRFLIASVNFFVVPIFIKTLALLTYSSVPDILSIPQQNHIIVASKKKTKEYFKTTSLESSTKGLNSDICIWIDLFTRLSEIVVAKVK